MEGLAIRAVMGIYLTPALHDTLSFFPIFAFAPLAACDSCWRGRVRGSAEAGAGVSKISRPEVRKTQPSRRKPDIRDAGLDIVDQSSLRSHSNMVVKRERSSR